MGRFLQILKINFQLSIRNNLLLAVLYLLAVPIWRGIENLNEVRAAECLEQSVVLIGILLLVPLCAPEQDAAVREAVSAGKMALWAVLLIRLVAAASMLAALTCIFAGIMKMKNCTFPYVSYVLGAAASEMALGSVGFFMAVFSNSVTAGCLAATGYFLCNYLGYIAGTSVFGLFSMGAGNFAAKIWLFGMSVLLAAAALVYVKERFRFVL